MADSKIQFLKPGTRTALAGRSGSGKSTLAAFMLARSRQKWLIIDPKIDDKIASLKPARVAKLDAATIIRAWDKSQYVAINSGDSEAIDALILECLIALGTGGCVLTNSTF
jgi:hypothetical protein